MTVHSNAPATLDGRPADQVLADDAALTEFSVAYGASLGIDRRPAAVALAFKAYIWAAVQPAIDAWARHRRVPDYSADRVAVRFHSAQVHMHRRDQRTAVLPSDPAANDPDVRVVPDEAALLESLRQSLVENHVSLAVEAFRGVRGGSARPLWGSVAAMLPHPATVTDAPLPERHAEAARVLDLLPEPARGLVEIAELNDCGHWRPMLIRRTCCYAYFMDGAEPCLTCCIPSDAERTCLAEQYGMCWRRVPSALGPDRGGHA